AHAERPVDSPRVPDTASGRDSYTDSDPDTEAVARLGRRLVVSGRTEPRLERSIARRDAPVIDETIASTDLHLTVRSGDRRSAGSPRSSRSGSPSEPAIAG